MRRFSKMTKLELEIHEDAVAVINKIKNVNDTGLELVIPEGSVLFDNVLNLKLIKKYADRIGSTVQFTTMDQLGNTLLEMLEERDGSPILSSMALDADNEDENAQEKFSTFKPKKKKMPMQFKMPKINVNFGAGLIIPIGLLVIGLLYIFVANNISKAHAKIVIATEPLVRSLTVKVSVSQPTSVEGKILSGSTVTTSLENTDVIDTTGEKITGKKAKGEVLLYNMTEEDIKLKKGSKIAYEDKDSIIYFTDEEVSVPKEILNETGTGTTFGEIAVKVTAENFGEEYNIKKDNDMEVNGYKSSVLNAKSKIDFTGGKSETIKIVSENDKKALSAKLLGVNTQESTASLEKSLKSGQKLISGSATVTVSGETFSKNVGDESDKLQLSQMVSVKGLVYQAGDLDKLIEKLADNLIPAGYKPAEKSKEIKAEVLGNVSSGQEAEIQATVKTYIIPDVDPEKIKEMLAGKSPSEAEKILGSTRNIKNYEFRLSPGLPLFTKVPKDKTKIEVEIEVD
jgi:hypothetical protein